MNSQTVNEQCIEQAQCGAVHCLWCWSVAQLQFTICTTGGQWVFTRWMKTSPAFDRTSAFVFPRNVWFTKLFDQQTVMKWKIFCCCVVSVVILLLIYLYIYSYIYLVFLFYFIIFYLFLFVYWTILLAILSCTAAIPKFKL